MQTRNLSFVLPLIAVLAACSVAGSHQPTNTAGPGVATGDRPMDETPVRKTRPNGDREYSYNNGCRVVLEPRRAVVKAESSDCQLHHRDISLLYASGD
ncbi:hypothetical protein [Pseudorhizobium marinum]|uniref:hypothetical protein n=1 Tax=Pseudorhizobium marinum TaxID=1496690 RepID=UPI0012DC391F|nr:hypothetical protein [Pseudorhizobium marinum]